MIPAITNKETPYRWYYPNGRGYILISHMDDNHILNAIDMLIQRKGHIHKKLPALVKEAIKRGLPLPDHKWIWKPKDYKPRSEKYIPIVKSTGYNPALRD